jgi:hypothetical protein
VSATEVTKTKGQRDFSVENTYDGCQLAVLCAIRDELKQLNALLHCSNFTGIPATLRSIRKNTAKPRRKRLAA